MSNEFALSANHSEDVRSRIDADGFAYIGDAIPEALLSKLEAECSLGRKSAKRAEGDIPLAYRSSLAPLGDIGHDLIKTQAPAKILKPLLGKDYRYCADASCYTFFEEGDFLSPHLDGADNCEITLLFYISASVPGANPNASGLYLSLYSEDANGDPQLKKSIPTPSGGIMIGCGSQVLHGRRRLAHGEHIWMLTACFCSV